MSENPFASPSASSALPSAPDYLPNHTRALVLMGALATSVALDGLAVITGLFELGAPMGDPLVLVLALATMAIGFGQIGVFLVCVVAWLLWMYRANANLRALGADGIEHTPGWAVGWWFVPFANLVKPYQVMQEIATKSALRSGDAKGPHDLLLVAWWLAWIVSNLGANLAVRYHGFEPSPEATVTWVILDVASAISGVLALLVIRGMDRVQEAAARREGLLS